MNLKKIFIAFVIGILSIVSLYTNGQTPDTVIKKYLVRNILISGNKKTKDYIIRREMQITEGEYIDSTQLAKRFETARQNVYNTTLFVEVKVYADIIADSVIDVVTTLRERWYLFPIPKFQLVDRNISDWLNNHNGDFSRTNYGIKLTHYNLTGRRDQLRITLLNGYTRNIAFGYTQAYSNSALTEGFSVNAGFSQVKEIAYKTNYNNKIAYLRSGFFSNQTWIANASYSIRRYVKHKHTFGIAYSNLLVIDSVLMPIYNPNYFNSSSSRQNILDITYAYQFTDVDNVSYALKGKTYNLTLLKRGIQFKGGTNVFLIEAGWGKYWDLKKDWYGSFVTSGQVKLPLKQAYINQRALGYGETYLRGMESYVVDAVAYTLAKSTLKKKIAFFVLHLPLKSKTLSRIPFTIFAKTYADIGYAYNKKEYDTYFNNRFLYTGGVGFDILTLYDFVLRVEYSFNQLGQNGLFLRTQNGL